MYCDLHVHSTASDGTVAPQALAGLAKQVGLGALALTDHDTTDGLLSCEAACRELGIAFVPGIEVSAGPDTLLPHCPEMAIPPRCTLHVLGLFVRPDATSLKHIETQMIETRRQRNLRVIEKLNTLGLEINYDDVAQFAQSRGSVIITRPHLAGLLVAKGYADSAGDAFGRYIGRGGPAYVPRQLLSIDDVLGVIHQARGLAILAHPVQLRCPDPATLKAFINCLKSLGLDGIETRHSDHTPQQTQQLERIAQELNLLTSGGSDFHSPQGRTELGSQNVPLEIYEQLRLASQER